MSRIAAVLLMLCVWAQPAKATVTVNPWTPIFKGIDFATGSADTNEPVLQQVKALRIDLADPDISFFSTPSNGTNDLETFGQKTSTFLNTYGLQVAVNANFFSPCCAATPNEPKDVLGLAISQGTLFHHKLPREPGPGCCSSRGAIRPPS